MKKTVYEVYELFVEVQKKDEVKYVMTAKAAQEALENAFMDEEKPRREFGTAVYQISGEEANHARMLYDEAMREVKVLRDKYNMPE